jgi:PAS domain S-box-containing protein
MPDQEDRAQDGRPGSLTGPATLRLAMLSLENSPDSVYWVDVSGRIVYANASAARTLGYSRDELSRMRVADIDPTCASGSWGPDGTMFRAAGDAGRQRYETVHRHREGRRIPVEVSAAHIEIEGRHYLAWTVRDISDRMGSGAREVRARSLPLAGARVLLVEDNRVNQRVARAILEGLGIGVEVAADGSAAVDAVGGGPERFDAVLMDVQMPVMDGCEATRVIRQRHPDATLPIIAVTANTLQSEREACIAAGMNDCVSKPVDPGRLEAVLERWIHRSRRPDRPAIAGPVVAAASAVESLGAIAGVDVAAALGRLDGKPDLLLRLLRGFVREHANSPLAIQEAIDRGEIQAALALAHGLKGVAGTLSATDVFEAARDLEACLRGAEAGLAGPHIERLGRALDVVAGSVAASAAPPGRGSVEAAERGSEPASTPGLLLAELDALLRTRRFSARKHFETVREQLAGLGLDDSLGEIQACLDRLDYGRARTLLPDLARKLGLSWHADEARPS